MTLLGALQIAIGLFQALPYIIQAILAVEAAVGAGQGPLKKSLVLAPIAATQDVRPEFTAAAGRMVDTLAPLLTKPPVPVTP